MGRGVSRTESRSRLTAYLPKPLDVEVRRLADAYFSGVLNDVLLRALESFDWIVRARLSGKRVVAIDEDDLPSRFEELSLPRVGPVGPKWQWLVEREHRWRRQLWVKGRKLTVGDVVSRLRFEHLTAEELAKDMDLPVDAVREAEQWASIPANAELIAAEDAEDALAVDSVAPAMKEPVGAAVRR